MPQVSPRHRREHRAPTPQTPQGVVYADDDYEHVISTLYPELNANDRTNIIPQLQCALEHMEYCLRVLDTTFVTGVTSQIPCKNVEGGFVILHMFLGKRPNRS